MKFLFPLMLFFGGGVLTTASPGFAVLMLVGAAWLVYTSVGSFGPAVGDTHNHYHEHNYELHAHAHVHVGGTSELRRPRPAESAPCVGKRRISA